MTSSFRSSSLVYDRVNIFYFSSLNFFPIHETDLGLKVDSDSTIFTLNWPIIEARDSCSR